MPSSSTAATTTAGSCVAASSQLSCSNLGAPSHLEQVDVVCSE